MSKQPPTALERLAAYEAAKLSTRPLNDEWSQSHQQDLVGNLGYTGHLIAANALAEFAPVKAAAIADIGCGTGLVGKALKTLGYSHIDGIDFSEKMLRGARRFRGSSAYTPNGPQTPRWHDRPITPARRRWHQAQPSGRMEASRRHLAAELRHAH